MTDLAEFQTAEFFVCNSGVVAFAVRMHTKEQHSTFEKVNALAG